MCERLKHGETKPVFLGPRSPLRSLLVPCPCPLTACGLPQRVVPMLPRLLCEELCSLNPGVERLAFSAEWRLSPDGEVSAPDP